MSPDISEKSFEDAIEASLLAGGPDAVGVGAEFSEADRVFIRQLEGKLVADEALKTGVRVNAPDNARLAFNHKVTDHLQGMVDTNFLCYKKVTDDPEFSRYLLDRLFERFRLGVAASQWDSGPPSAP